MYNTKFIDQYGNELYPGYLDKDKRSELKKQYGSAHGYCRSLAEQYTFGTLNKIANEDPVIKFWLLPDDPSVGAIVSVKDKPKKILVLFRSKENEQVTVNRNIYIPIVVDEDMTITADEIHKLLD